MTTDPAPACGHSQQLVLFSRESEFAGAPRWLQGGSRARNLDSLAQQVLKDAVVARHPQALVLRAHAERHTAKESPQAPAVVRRARPSKTTAPNSTLHPPPPVRWCCRRPRRAAAPRRLAAPPLPCAQREVEPRRFTGAGAHILPGTCEGHSAHAPGMRVKLLEVPRPPGVGAHVDALDPPVAHVRAGQRSVRSSAWGNGRKRRR